MSTIEGQLANFSTTAFALQFAAFGIPFTVVAVGAAILMWFVNFKVWLFPAWVASWNFQWITDSASYAKFRVLTKILGIVFAVLCGVVPLLFLFLWGVTAAVYDPPATAGLFVIFLGVAGMSSLYGLLLWRASGWRMTRIPLIALSLGGITIAAFLLALLFLSPPFSYTGISFLFAALNMLPMTIIAHIVAPGLRVDFKRFIEETQTQPSSAVTLPVINEEDEFNKQRNKVIVLYIGALAILLSYALLVWFVSADGKGVGFITAGSIVLTDICIYLYYRSGLMTSPTMLSIVLTGIRAAFVSWGPFYWFLGHCTVVLIVSVFLSIQVIKKLYPIEDKEAKAQEALDPSMTFLYHILLQVRDRVAASQHATVPASTDQPSTASDVTVAVPPTPASAVVAKDESAIGRMKALLETNTRWLVVLLAILVLLFVVDIIIVGALKAPLIIQIPLVSNNWDQYLFGLIILVLSIVVPLGFFSYQYFKVQEQKLNLVTLLTAAACEIVTVGAGVFIFELSGSWTQLWVAVFLPIILFSMMVSLSIWFKNDFDFLRPATERKGWTGYVGPVDSTAKPADPVVTTAPADATAATTTPATTEIVRTEPPNVFVAFFRGWLPLDDYLIVLNCFLYVASVIFLGMAIALTAGLAIRWVAWTISFAFGLLTFSALPLMKWFNTYQFDLFIGITAGIAVALLAGWTGAMLGTVFYIGTVPGLVIIFFSIMYLICVLAGSGIYQWRDDKWKLDVQGNTRSKFVVFNFVFCGLIIIGFDIALWVLAWIAGLAALFVILIVAYVCVLCAVWVKNNYYLPTPWRISSVVLLVVVAGVGIGVGFVTARPFFGFTASWGCLFLVLAVMAVREETKRMLDSTLRIQYSPFVFPVFKYSAKSDDIEMDNKKAGIAYLALIVAGIWGILCAVFIYPTYVGVGVTALVMVITIIYTSAKIRAPDAEFGRAYTVLTQDMLTTAMKQAFVKQVNKGLTISAAKVSLGDEASTDDAPADASAVSSKNHYTAVMQEFVQACAGQVAPLYSVLVYTARKAQKPISEVHRWAFILNKNQVMDAAKIFDASLPSGQVAELDDTVATIKANVSWPMTEQQILSTVIGLDTVLAELFDETTRFRVNFQILAVMAADFQRAREAALWRDMLQKLKIDVDPSAINAWADADKENFRRQFEAYRIELEKAEADIRRKREMEERANAERERLLREEEERKQEEIRKHLEEEEERRRHDSEEAAERKRQHEAAEKERIRQEQEHQRLMKEKHEKEERDRLAQEEIARKMEALRIQHVKEEEQRRLEAEAAEAKRRKEDEERKEREAEAKRKAAVAAEQQRLELEEKMRRAKEAAMQKELEEAQRLFEERQARLKAEEEAHKRAEAQRKAEEAARLKKLQEEEAHRKAEQARQEAELKKRLEQEEAQRKKAAEEKRLADEAARKAEATRKAEEEKAEAERRRLAALSGPSSSVTIPDPLSMKSEVEGILKALPPGQRYIDTEFPATNKSLWKVKQGENYKWKRAPEIFPQGYEVFKDGASAFDAKQGALGDCWLLSAMNVLARQDRLKPLFISTEHKDRGLFSLQFFKDGRWRSVIVDDFFPVEGTRQFSPAFVHPENSQELWMMLIEKAYAKLHGSYEAIEMGSVSAGFVDMTGGVGLDISMDSAQSKKDIFSGAFWSKLVEYFNAGYLLGAGSPAGSDTDTSPEGIVQGHAYAILHIEEVDGIKLIHLRNPWGTGEWKGKWCDGYSGWTKRLRAKLNVVDADDGAFWMELADFTVHFRTVYVCRLFENLVQRMCESEWKGITAGGCMNNAATFQNNPQFLLTVTRPTTFFIVLRQSETRGTGKKATHIGFTILDKGGKRAKCVYVGEGVGDSGTFINSREVSCEIRLQPKEYTIVCSTFAPKVETGFSLLAYSDDDASTLSLIPTSVPAK